MSKGHKDLWALPANRGAPPIKARLALAGQQALAELRDHKDLKAKPGYQDKMEQQARQARQDRPVRQALQGKRGRRG